MLPRLALPGEILPLHIFEQRYRKLVEDLLDRSGRMVIGTVLPEWLKLEPKHYLPVEIDSAP